MNRSYYHELAAHGLRMPIGVDLVLHEHADHEARLLDGAALGVGCWAAGYLGWLPASGLSDPVWRQPTAAAIAPAVRHAAYGIATVAAYETLAEHL